MALAIPFASALALAVAACTAPVETDSAPEVDDVEAPPAAEPGAPLPPPPLVGDVCPDTTRVGKMLNPGVCPPAVDPGWSRQSLFGAGAPVPLSQYCIYTWTAAGAPNLAGLPADGGRSGTAWTDADCMAVTTASPADDAEGLVRGNLEQSFWDAVERPSAMPARQSPGIPVRVEILDTWPGRLMMGNSAHGAGMGGIIQNLTCDLIPGVCPISLHPRLALDMVEPGVHNTITGGTFGYQSHLAVEVYHAVSAWKADPSPSHLVINLSIGWDPRFETRSSGADRPSAFAVREALDNAACSGALVIAAAGNSGFGVSPTAGLVYPAAWAPVTASCGGKPILWAVGGVDAKDRPLYNARTGGIPKLVAPGELAYGEPSVVGAAGPFTGSSASTAVASAAAATLWMYDDALTPSQVMAQVLATAAPLSVSATACASSGCGNAKRISICRAARSKAPGGASAVPCAQHPEGGGVLPVWTAAQAADVDALALEHFVGPALDTPLPAGAPCSRPIFVPSGTVTFAGPSQCPLEQYPNAVLAPSVGPQPGPDPCGACAISATSVAGDPELQIAVSKEMKDNVHLQVLSLYKSGALSSRYDVGSLTTLSKYYARDGFAPGEVYRLTLPGVTHDFDAAVIEWVNAPGMDIQTSSKIVVY